ncbi:MAG TPA: hypothetical protein VNA69_01160 [Thermoanaerobaculia bacterium]|nr:hypothetical protein [Thermoanaerobaculia bacterium]
MGSTPIQSAAPVSRLGIALIALVVAAHLAGVIGDIERPLHVDEAEYLHATWLMDQGRTIYRDFMQDHPPFLFQFMNLFNPREGGGIYPLLDIERWTAVGRIFAGLCGAIVLIAAAMLSYLATRNALAGLVALAFILQDPLIWQRGLADLRLDPFAMAMLWGGALLIALTFGREPRRSDALLSGSGIALVAAAALLNPKWPLESIVIGVVYLMTLWRLRRRGWSQVLLSLLPTAIVLAGAAAALWSVTTFAEYLYFTFQLKTGIQQHLLSRNVYGLSDDVAWWTVIESSDVVIVLACALLVLAARRWPIVREHVDVSRAMILVALCVASIAELPFFEPYTVMWAQYRVSYKVAAGVLYGIVVALLYAVSLRMIARRRAETRGLCVALFTLAVALVLQWVLVFALLQRTSPVARTLVALCIVAGWIPAVAAFLHASGRRTMRDAEHRLPMWSATIAAAGLSVMQLTPVIVGRGTGRDEWRDRAHLQRVLRRGDRVWLTPRLHPIAAHDASYFWYAFGDVTAGAMAQATRSESLLPRIREQDLPPCRISAGLDRETRFVEFGSWLEHYPVVARCALALLDRGALAATSQDHVFEVRRENQPIASWGLSPKKAAFRLRRLEYAARHTIETSRGAARPLPSSQ